MMTASSNSNNNNTNRTEQEQEEELVPAINCSGDYNEILEMFESFSGWYWFSLIKRPYPDEPSIRYGYVVGFEKEFGTFDLDEMEPLIKQGKIWKVPKINWSSNSNVSLVPRSKITKLE